MSLTTADLPDSLRPDPVRQAVRQARVITLPRQGPDPVGLGPCAHADQPLRGVRCPECLAESAVTP